MSGCDERRTGRLDCVCRTFGRRIGLPEVGRCARLAEIWRGVATHSPAVVLRWAPGMLCGGQVWSRFAGKQAAEGKREKEERKEGRKEGKRREKEKGKKESPLESTSSRSHPGTLK